MNKPFFVMRYASDNLVPLLDNKDNVALYKTFNSAKQAALRSILGRGQGFEIFNVQCSSYSQSGTKELK